MRFAPFTGTRFLRNSIRPEKFLLPRDQQKQHRENKIKISSQLSEGLKMFSGSIGIHVLSFALFIRCGPNRLTAGSRGRVTREPDSSFFI
jgi:hypothetical protein